jgi:hypothetical protein
VKQPSKLRHISHWTFNWLYYCPLTSIQVPSAARYLLIGFADGGAGAGAGAGGCWPAIIVAYCDWEYCSVIGRIICTAESCGWCVTRLLHSEHRWSVSWHQPQSEGRKAPTIHTAKQQTTAARLNQDVSFELTSTCFERTYLVVLESLWMTFVCVLFLQYGQSIHSGFSRKHSSFTT